MGALVNLFRRSSQTRIESQTLPRGSLWRKNSAGGNMGGGLGNLTIAQRGIIARTWPKIYIDIPGNGVNVMLRLIMMQSDVKMLFNFRNKTDNDMVLDRCFCTHSCRFIQAVMAVIENIDNLEETIVPLFLRLGRKHVTVPDFEAKYFKMLPDAYCLVWESQLAERFTEQMEKAWRIIFDFIVNQMVDGFEIESQLRQRARSLRKIVVKPDDLASSRSTMTTVDNESEMNDPRSRSSSAISLTAAQATSEPIATSTATFPATVPEVHVETRSDILESPSNVAEESTREKEAFNPSQSEGRHFNGNAEEV